MKYRTEKHVKAAAALIALACTLAMPAAGDTWSLAANESSATTYSALTNAYSWLKSIGNNTTVRSGAEGEPLSPDEDYSVDNGRTMVTPAVSTTFKGKSMTLGSSKTEGRVRHRAGGAAVIDWNDGETGGLTVRRGFYITYAGGNVTSEVHGSVCVTSPTNIPFAFAFSYTNSKFFWHGDFTGETGTGFRIEGLNYASQTRPPPLIGGSEFKLYGSLSGYFGTIGVSNTTFSVESVTIPGTLELSKGAVLTTHEATNVVAVGTLELGPGAVLSFNADADTNSVVVVTNALAVNGLVTVRVDADAYVSSAAQMRPLLRVPPGVELSPGMFVLDLPDMARFVRTHLAVETDATTGEKVLVAVLDEAKPVVTQIVTDANVRDNGNANGVPYASSMTNDAAWSDGHVPQEGRHYVVQKIGSNATLLRTATDTTLDWTFPGESLTIGASCWFGQFHKSVTFKDFNMLDGSLFQLGVGVNPGAIKGRLNLPSGIVRILTYNSTTLNVEADMHGTARIVMDGTHSSSSGRSASTEYLGDNSDFHGTMTVSMYLDPVYVKNSSATTNSQNLCVSDPAKLGAPLPQFDATALVLKRNATLRAKGSVTFNDATRGIYIGEDGTGTVTYQTTTSPLNSYARFHVDAGETMALRPQLTLNGQLHKRGAGTLALGGPLRFGPAVSVGDEPVSDANLLFVDEGFVKPLAVDSFNGMEMTFAAGTGIRLDIDPADTDLRTYGLRNVKAVTPFAAAAGGTIPVTFDVPAGFEPPDRFTVGVATGPAEAVALLSVGDPHLQGFRMETAVETVDGVATLRATFRLRGMRLILR